MPRKKLTRRELTQVSKKLVAVKRLQHEIGLKRDALRSEIAAVEELLEDLDSADGNFSEGISRLEDGLDIISRTI